MNEVAIFIPTFGRAHKLDAVYKNASDNSPGATVYFIAETGDSETLNVLSSRNYKYFINNRAKSYSGAVNCAYLNTTEPFMFCGADDLNFQLGWLSKVMEKFNDNTHVVGTNDLGNSEVLAGNHATHYMVRRKYVEEQGAIFDAKLLAHEGYVHNWTDWEVIKLAQQRGVFQPCLEAIVEHLHWGWGKSPKDDTYRKQEGGSWDSDANLFNQRSKLWMK